MSLICRKLCSFILFEHFGQIVQCVGEDLFKYGAKPLVLIRHTTHLPVTKVIIFFFQFIVCNFYLKIFVKVII